MSGNKGTTRHRKKLRGKSDREELLIRRGCEEERNIEKTGKTVNEEKNGVRNE